MMATDLKPIETKYDGWRFRSRLEARWAVFFDALGVNWEYEKEGFDLGDGIYYLPDFWIKETGRWIEIKPEGYPLDDERLKAKRLAQLSGFTVLIFDGAPWELWDIGAEFYGWESKGDHAEIYHIPGVDFPAFVSNKLRADLAKYAKAIGNHDRPTQEWGRQFVIGHIEKAILVAKQARFEHGEQPAGRRSRLNAEPG